MSQSTPFITTRTLKAPIDLVFKVWTDPAHMSKWLSPKGMPSHYVTADIRPGGGIHYYMSLPDGGKMWGRTWYKEITKPTKIVYVQAFSNEKGEITAHPMSPTWPKQMLTTVNFEKAPGDQTQLTLSWAPIDATAEELATFEQGKPGMNQGWGGTFEQLNEYLAALQ